jgi:ELWxxDGT repeat protein
MTDGQTMTPLGPLNPTGSSFPQSFIESDGKIYFSATDGGSVVGWELWEWNGVASTAINLNPGTADSIPSYLAVAGGKLFMNADIGAEGRELVVVDTGSPASVNINTGGGLSSTPANLVEWNGLVYFSADDGTNDYQLWSSNGGAVGSGTAIALGPIAEIGWGPQYFLTPMGDFMLLVAEHTGYGHEWFRFENGALTLVKDIYSGPSGSFPERPLSAEGNLYFLADDGTGYDLWRTDGTEAGTINLLEPAGLGPMNSCNETVLGVYEGVVYLALDSDADFSAELWRTDGTAEGTERLGEVIVEYYDPSCD